jgi:hypothetical protein
MEEISDLGGRMRQEIELHRCDTQEGLATEYRKTIKRKPKDKVV